MHVKIKGVIGHAFLFSSSLKGHEMVKFVGTSSNFQDVFWLMMILSVVSTQTMFLGMFSRPVKGNPIPSSI